MSFGTHLIPEVALHSVTPDLWEANTAHYSQLIDVEANWQSIPLLNYVHSENVRNQQLVRFRGMIQNMCNPEFFLDKYEVHNTVTGLSTVRSGKLKDTVDCKENERIIEDSEHNQNSERDTWLCVPVPAVNDWVSFCWKKPHLKRHLNRLEDEESSKRALSDVQPSRQPCTQDTSEFTLAEPQCRTCYVKLYDMDTSSYMLNDVIEVAGFLSFFNNFDAEEFEMEDILDSKVPRLHVVACKNLSQHNLLLPEVIQDAAIEDMQSVRNDLHLLLTQILLGDTLAANYLLCHLLSSVYSRTDMLALGQLPLNIFNIPKLNYAKNMYSILELLVVKSVFLPLSLENLNQRILIPKKDYGKEQLCEGLLQLSPHTHLVLDETQMQSGKLETLGCRNVAALRKLVLEQKVSYDFQFYELYFDCDIPVLIFSEGKSLFPCSIIVPLESDERCLENIPEIFQAAEHFLQPQLLQRIRAYIILAQSASFNINPEMQKVIQEDFVKLRQNKEINTSADDLHNLIILARLMALSVGEAELTDKTWKQTLNMEIQRKQRMALVNPS